MNDLIHYDIIADIHGRFDKLTALMERMGYQPAAEGFIPPAGHRALFLGDLIDPKPGHALPGGVHATLRAVKAMCDAGHALCLMGKWSATFAFPVAMSAAPRRLTRWWLGRMRSRQHLAAPWTGRTSPTGTGAGFALTSPADGNPPKPSGRKCRIG